MKFSKISDRSRRSRIRACRSALSVGAGIAVFWAFSGIFSPISAEPGRVVPLPQTESAEEEDTGFATSTLTVRAQSSSLLDNLSFMFKKEGKEKGTESADSAEPKIIKRRPLAERLELDNSNLSVASEPVKSDTLSALSVEELMSRGDAAYSMGDREDAAKFYMERVARSHAQDGIDESLVSAYHRLGVINRELQDYGKAQEYLVLAVKSDPSKNPQLTLDYARVLYETGKYERAQKLFNFLIEKRPEITDARYYNALCVLNLDPESPEAFAGIEEKEGRERACELVAEKCRELGKTAKAEEMTKMLETIRDSALESAASEETAGLDTEELASVLETETSESASSSPLDSFGAASSDSAESGVVSLGRSNADVGNDPIRIKAVEEGDAAKGTEVGGLDQDQTTRINSPLIDLETIGPKRIMVGQESEYKIAVENKSNQTADNLVVRTEIPDDVEITCVNASAGTSHISGGESDEPLVCYWNLGNYEPSRKETLVFKFTPRVRSNINFVTVYDYDKAVLNSGIEVTQPVLEMAIDGSDTIEWGSEQRYQVKIQNVGDGEARNIRLTVSTGDNDNATRILKSLAPGEEKQLELNMKTVLDGVLSINAVAEADYGFSAEAEKDVDILRGNLDLFVEVPEVQFVNESTDYVVHVCNTGRASLRDVEVVAAVPTSIEVVSATGNPIRNDATNQMVWTIPNIKPEEEILYQVNAKLLRAGNSRLDVTAADRTGISCFGNAQVQVEAIAALEMKINKPTGAIATGKEVVYEVVINNCGTKAAERIDAGFFLPAGMTPIAVEGGGKVIAEDSKVLFNKINFLGPGQTVVYKVRAVAEERGNHKVQAVLESKTDNVQLVSEEMNFFYDRKPSLAQRGSRQDQTAVTAAKPVSHSKEAPVRLAARPDADATMEGGLPDPDSLDGTVPAHSDTGSESPLPGPHNIH